MGQVPGYQAHRAAGRWRASTAQAVAEDTYEDEEEEYAPPPITLLEPPSDDVAPDPEIPWIGPEAGREGLFTDLQREQILTMYLAGKRTPEIPTGWAHILREGLRRYPRPPQTEWREEYECLQLWCGRLHNGTLVIMTPGDLTTAGAHLVRAARSADEQDRAARFRSYI